MRGSVSHITNLDARQADWLQGTAGAASGKRASFPTFDAHFFHAHHAKLLMHVGSPSK
jgi:hypothetical protein